ncbi:MAG: hypothetical protein ABJN40_13410 [Sneathiella sp.]
MKLYNRAEFLKLPKGTIYAKGEEWAFDSLAVKGESLKNDWWYFDPSGIEVNDSGEMIDRFENMKRIGTSYPMDDCFYRDGMFEENDLFMVFELDDLVRLKGFVEVAIQLMEKGGD